MMVRVGRRSFFNGLFGGFGAVLLPVSLAETEPPPRRPR